MEFGFDSETKDYKIVRIAGDFLGGQESTNKHPQLSFTAEVYTMSTNYWHITGETFTARLGSEVFPEPCPGYSQQLQCVKRYGILGDERLWGLRILDPAVPC
ncbi:hypothetical protein PanWU01x14_277450 [Parasponia andersonii]|uniref:Uncharacterized protein n=1 Tax=Parasponia andersonii TaxID=3476 RepID=A0A2P5B2F8_PARAD|nr:hypothetical protein PanWU01x14_277450 [Parasponia andersonii]